MDACRSGEKVDADGSQFSGRKFELRSRIRLQTGFASAIQEDREFNEVLIREAVRTVIGNGRRLFQIGRCKFRRERMEFQIKKAKPADVQALDWKLWLGSATDQPFSDEKFNNWRWFWNFGGGAITDLFTHWIDVVHWAMKSDAPREAQMLANKYVFEQWDCPDTIQAAFHYPGFDVVYEGMMASWIDDGGLEFRGTEATLKVNRNGTNIYREGVPANQNPIVTEHGYRDGTIQHMQNFFECLKTRKEPNAPVEAGIAAARAGHIANLAYHGNGQIAWPPKAS